MNKQEINHAISEHALWKFNLNNLISKGKLETPMSVIKAQKECDFGKWLEGPDVVPRLKSSVHHKEVKKLHAEFHEIAAKVVSLVSKGKKTEAEKLMEPEGEFTERSRDLIEAMTKWKDSI